MRLCICAGCSTRRGGQLPAASDVRQGNQLCAQRFPLILGVDETKTLEEMPHYKREPWSLRRGIALINRNGASSQIGRGRAAGPREKAFDHRVACSHFALQRRDGRRCLIGGNAAVEVEIEIDGHQRVIGPDVHRQYFPDPVEDRMRERQRMNLARGFRANAFADQQTDQCCRIFGQHRVGGRVFAAMKRHPERLPVGLADELLQSDDKARASEDTPPPRLKINTATIRRQK